MDDNLWRIKEIFGNNVFQSFWLMKIRMEFDENKGFVKHFLKNVVLYFMAFQCTKNRDIYPMENIWFKDFNTFSNIRVCYLLNS